MSNNDNATPGKFLGVLMLGGSFVFLALATAGKFSSFFSIKYFDVAEMILALAVIYWIYRGVRILFNWHPAVVVLLVPFVYMAAVVLGYFAGSGDEPDRIASFIENRGIGDGGSTEENPFNGRNARNTNVEDLDTLMEEW